MRRISFRRWGVAIATLLGVGLTALPAVALQLPAPGAVSPEKVKLPDAPGSVRGLAAEPSVAIFSGQVGYAVPLELPKGEGGLVPQISLIFAGELGNGPLGVGWTLGTIAIRRSLRHGVPSYSDADELELVGLGGGSGGGRLVAAGDGSGVYWVEGQGKSIRVQWTGSHFQVWDGNGFRYLLGATAEARQIDPKVPGRVAAWYVQRIFSPAPRTTPVRFSYFTDVGEVFLKEVEWGPDHQGAPAYRLVIDYEDRPDRAISFRTGFETQMRRRIARLRVDAFGEELRAYHLQYENIFALSRLRNVRMTGRGGQDALPDLTLGYAARPPVEVVPVSGLDGWALNERGTSFFDVDGDGMSDLLRLELGNHEYRKNYGSAGFGPRRPIQGATDVALESAQLMDLDGDARADLVHIADDRWRVHRLDGERWTEQQIWPGSEGLPFEERGRGTVLADVNGDGRTDVLQATGQGLQITLNKPDGSGFAATRSVPPISPSNVAVAPGNPDVRFTDVNGDGLVDAAWMTDAWMNVYLGRGDGTFRAYRRVEYPWGQGAFPVTDLQLRDLNRDGLIDLIRFGAGHVHWYPGRADVWFTAEAERFVERPPGAAADAVVTIADANGNGSDDIVWSSGQGMWVLDLAGGTSAGMLSEIANGFGKRVLFDYGWSARLSVDAELAGRPWRRRLPVSVPVPIRMEIDLAGVGGPSRVMTYDVEDGFWDGTERRFGGFLRSRSTHLGDSPALSLVDTNHYLEGSGAERVLRGRVSLNEQASGAGEIFSVVQHEWRAAPVDGLGTNPLLQKAALIESRSRHLEGRAGAAPIETHVRYLYDGLVRQEWEIQAGRTDLSGDEKTFFRRYTDSGVGNDEPWVRDRICEEKVFWGDRSFSDPSALVSHIQTLYTADGTTALPACSSAGRGWLAERRGYLDTESRWVSLARHRFDGCGNATELYDEGVNRTIVFDDSCLYPIQERVQPEADRTLTWGMTWDRVLGVPSAFTDPNADVIRLSYDPLGRQTAAALNDLPPHVRYVYEWGAPQPRIRTFLFDGSLATLASGAAFPGPNWREEVLATNGAGEEILRATRLGQPGREWIVTSWSERDGRGQTRVAAEPFYWSDPDLPSALPAGTPVRSMDYDALSRPVQDQLPTGAVKQVAYGAFTQTVTLDGLAPVRSDLDGALRIFRTERNLTEAGTGVEQVTASYDPADRLLSMSLQGGQVVHRFRYDSLGRLIEGEDPDIGRRRLAYRDEGWLVRHENGAGQVLRFEHDRIGRLTRRWQEGDPGQQFRFYYDLPMPQSPPGVPPQGRTQGRLSWVEEPEGRAQLGYDGFSRQSFFRREVQLRSGWQGIEYSPSGLALREVSDDGFTLTSRYDAAGRLTEFPNVWRAADLDASGRVVDEVYGTGGARQTVQRDSLGLPSQIQVSGGGQLLYGVAIQRNAYGAPISVADQDGTGLDHTAGFTYDQGGRLTSATLGTGGGRHAFTYRYDALQNMTARGATGPRELGLLTGSYAYGVGGSGPRQLASVAPSGGGAPVTFSYDGAGRQVREGEKRLVWNGVDQLLRAELPPSRSRRFFGQVRPQDLGSFGGESQATAINNAGQVAGFSYSSSGAPRPFRYADGGGLQDLGVAGCCGVATGIASDGRVVGSAAGPQDLGRPFRDTPTAPPEFPAAFPASAQGRTGGIAPGGAFAGCLQQSGQLVAFQYTEGAGVRSLGTLPGGANSCATDLSDAGLAVGWSAVAGTPSSDPWNPGHAVVAGPAEGLTDLNDAIDGRLGWELRRANAISDDGRFIVGFGALNGAVRAFRYAAGTVRDLGAAMGGGGAPSTALGVNNRGDVVGTVHAGSGADPRRAFVYTDDTGLVDLNTLVDPREGWTLLEARGINESRQVAGVGLRQGQVRAFRLQLPDVRVDDTGGPISVRHGYGYDGLRISTIAGLTAERWFLPNYSERGQLRDHYVQVGDRLVARVRMRDGPAAGPASAAASVSTVGPTSQQMGRLLLLLTFAAGLILALTGLRRRGRRWVGATAGLLFITFGSSSCGLLGLDDATGAQWTLVETIYFHKGVAAGPTLMTRADGSVFEERRFEPFGQPVDAFRQPGGAGAVDLRAEPHNILNKETNPETGWSFHGARWMAPQTARWLSPDPPLKAPDSGRMARPWDLNPYQYVWQNPMTFWDPDGEDSQGHHYVGTQRVAAKLVDEGQLSQTLADEFNRRSTGWPEGVLSHQNSAAHIEYDKGVKRLLPAWAKREGIDLRTVGTKEAPGVAGRFIEYLKKTKAPIVRAFLDPHLKVVEMARQGKSAAQINKYWEPIRASFTKGGGWRSLARAGGGLLRAGGKLFNVLGFFLEIGELRDEQILEEAGFRKFPVEGSESVFPLIYQWGNPGECLGPKCA